MKIIESHILDATTLSALLECNVDCVRVPNFYPLAACKEITKRMETLEVRGHYENAQNVGRIGGRAFFEKQSSDVIRREYEADSLKWIMDLRSAFSPYQNPIDKLRLVLDEAWDHGATLATIDGFRAFCGLIRTFSPGFGTEAHQDVLAWDLGSGSPEGVLVGQFAANIYTSVPRKGGELLIWPMSLDRERYVALSNGSYGVRVDSLPAPTVIRPKTGELILFNSRLLHAVNSDGDRIRVTTSCFIGYRGKRKSLSLWS